MALRLTGLEGEHLQEASEDNEEFSLGHGLSDTDPLTNTERYQGRMPLVPEETM